MKSIVSMIQNTSNRMLVGAASFLFVTSGILSAQAGQKPFVRFNDFVASTQAANSSDFLGQPTSKVKDEQSFEEMRQHILNLYEGVQVSHSFVLDGDHFDCVPEVQQPGVRLQGLKNVVAPPSAAVLSQLFEGNVDRSASADQAIGASQIAGREVDEFGNSRVCESNTIAMRRVTLEETSRFATLKNYLEKGPDGSGQAPHLQTPGGDAVEHKYSYTYQYVNNFGDTDTLSLWSPYVNTSLGEVFSLAQSWTTSYTPVTQTAEVGWQNYPAFYGGENSRLFIYWTADGYNKTGCYNLTCAGFVQYGGTGWTFGAGWGSYSKIGGSQYEFTARYYFSGGNWFLGLGTSPTNATWVGYFPASIYGSGPMATHSQLIEFGSESVGSNPWPAEGSGDWASDGFDYAGYQRALYHWADPGYAATWDSLTADQPSPNCYTIAGPYNGGWNPPSNDWGIYFYYGGPGGYNCD
jgi:Neprosin